MKNLSRHRLPLVLAAALGALPLLLAQVPTAQAQVSVSDTVRLPGVDISVYPELVPVPGYPVYYAPQVNENLFFYDGLYWVYEQDAWYNSSWYNGPWLMVDAFDVPDFILRVPVRYYRTPPPYFRGWSAAAAPHWGEHWGRRWQQRRADWNRRDRERRPAAAPLPAYQRNYAAERYPATAERQREIQSQHDRGEARRSTSPQRDERRGFKRGERHRESGDER